MVSQIGMLTIIEVLTEITETNRGEGQEKKGKEKPERGAAFMFALEIEGGTLSEKIEVF